MKVLVNNESSHISSGYGVMGKEIISRLHNRGIIVSELAGYLQPNGPRQLWKTYPNEPDPNNQEERRRYESNPINGFGLWKWEQTCLDFQNTHTFSVRDFWMSNFEDESPFRDFYALVQVPTVDARPQADHWTNLYVNCDAILSYSEWGGEILKKQSSNKINYRGTASPAPANEYQFIPNKRAHKDKLGINPDALIIGMVARNQKRKLFPALMKGFAQYLRAGPPELTKLSFLYCHTSYPDIGYDLRNLIKEHGIGNRVLFTYICKNCQLIFPNVFQDTQVFCRRCSQQACVTVNHKNSIENKTLADIVGLFDVYVQMACAEGFGIPVVEAAACGVPTMVVNYSAMEDFPKTLNSIPINYLELEKESETGRYFAVPDLDDFNQKLVELLSLPEQIRANIGFKSSQLARQNYSWDKTVDKLIEVFNSVKPKLPWNHPPRYHQPNLNIQQGLNNEQFIKAAIIQVLGLPEKLNTYFEAALLRDLNMGCSVTNWGGPYYSEFAAIGASPPKDWIKEFNRDILVRDLLNQRNNFNEWERRRYAKFAT